MGHKSINLFAKRNNATTKWLRTKINIGKNRQLQLKSKSTQIMNNAKKISYKTKITIVVGTQGKCTKS